VRDVEQYIGKIDESNFFFKFTAQVSGNMIVKGTEDLYVEDIDRYISAENILPKSNADHEKDGNAEMIMGINDESNDKINTGNGKVNAALYAGYDRIKARDHANQYTSNTTKYCSHNKALQDTAYWNTSVYPAFLYNFCHNDCADYVSQAINYGGIPKDATWTRTSADKSWTYAWQNVAGLRNYMLNTKNYWKPSTWENASAGGGNSL